MRTAVVFVLIATGSALAQFSSPAPFDSPAPLESSEPTPTPTPAPGDTKTFVPMIAREDAAAGNTAFANKDYAAARIAYRKVLDLVPDNLLALINLGVVEFSAGNNDEAIRLEKKAVQIKLDAPPAWLTLGIIYMNQNKLDEALAALSQATLYDPQNARARNYLGVVIGRKGWIDGAESELSKAIELDPNYSDAYYNLAAFYLQSNPPAIELARRQYYRAVELGAAPDPDMERTLKGLPPLSPTPSPTPQPTP